MECCQKMIWKPHTEKIEFLRTKGICFASLNKGHMSKGWRKCLTCGSCNLKHPTLLHIITTELSQKEHGTTTMNEENPVSSTLVSLQACGPTGAGAKDCALAILPIQIKSSRIVTTFLDPGSSVTFCTVHFMKQEDLKKWHYLKDVHLTTINAEVGLLIGINAPKLWSLGRLLTVMEIDPMQSKPVSEGRLMVPWAATCLLKKRVDHAWHQIGSQ